MQKQWWDVSPTCGCKYAELRIDNIRVMRTYSKRCGDHKR